MTTNQAGDGTSREPIQPGCIRLVKLKEEGRLQPGDTVETARLGACEVTFIQSANTICVMAQSGQHFTLSGLGFRARLESRTKPIEGAH